MYLISINARATTWFLVIPISVNIITIGFAVHSINGQASFSGGQPIINDPSLKADLVFEGLRNPTSIAFLGPNDILVLEKDQGTVHRIINGNMLPHLFYHCWCNVYSG